MRRGVVFAVAVLSGLSPAVNAQYPYAPYPTYGPMPGYGYPPALMQPMPAYVPSPMPSRPVYYYYQQPVQRPAAPMYQPQPQTVYPSQPQTIYQPTAQRIDQTTVEPKVLGGPNLPDENFTPIVPTTPSVSTPAPAVRALPTLFKAQPDLGPAAPMEVFADTQPRGEARRGGIFAGVGFYLMQPRFQGNPAFQLSTVAPGAPITGSQRDFTYTTSMSPQAIIGYETESGLGIRGKGWRFDQKAQEGATIGLNGFATPANPLGLGGALPAAAGDQVAASSSLRLDVYEIEVTQRWDPSRTWAFVFGGGVRYAFIGQDYAFSATTPGVGTTGSVTSHRTFSGVGPILSLDVHRGVGGGGFGLYGSGRGSVLFGATHQQANLSSINPFTGLFGLTATNNTSRSSVVSNLEFEIGAEYRRPVGRMELFLQAGFVGHVWFGAGNASNTDSTFTGNTNNNSNLGFLGLAVRAGVKY